MAFILIDGYNLIGTAQDNLKDAREHIINKLQNYARIKKHDITIVFDGWKSGQAEQARMKSRHVTVIYSRLGENADSVIMRMLSPAGKPWIVISSDREITDFAFRHGFAAVHSEEFEFRMDTCLRDAEEGTDPGKVSLPLSGPGGYRGKLSRRQRKKFQALRKL